MNVRTLSHLLLGLLLLMLARHLWLAAYVHPFGDDFSYSVAGMRTPLLERLLREYDSWNGRYFSNVLVLRNPMVLGLSPGLMLYRFAAVGLVLLTIAGVYSLVRAWIGTLLNRMSALIVALCFTLLFLHIMPDANEGFYWYTGAVTYQLASALSLFLIASWITHFRNGSSGSIEPSAWINVLLVIAIIGCNEVHMVFVLLGHLILFWSRYGRTLRVDRSTLLVLAVSIACAAVVILAPGNENRGDQFELKHDILRTLMYSVAQTGRFIGKWLFLSPLLLITLLVPGYARWLSARSPSIHRVFDIDRWIALALPLAVVFIPFVVTYWPTGLLGQYRTANVACFYFLITWPLAVAVWDQQVLRWQWVGAFVPDSPRGVAISTAVFALFLVLGRDRDVNDDLLSGRVVRYNTAIHERYRAVEAAIREERPQLELPPLKDTPRSLMILPLNPSPDHWMNRSLADYFGKPQLDIIAGGSPTDPQ